MAKVAARIMEAEISTRSVPPFVMEAYANGVFTRKVDRPALSQDAGDRLRRALLRSRELIGLDIGEVEPDVFWAALLARLGGSRVIRGKEHHSLGARQLRGRPHLPEESLARVLETGAIRSERRCPLLTA